MYNNTSSDIKRHTGLDKLPGTMVITYLHMANASIYYMTMAMMSQCLMFDVDL